MRVPSAFDPATLSAMRDAIWRVLGEAGIERDRPASWTVERPPHLQALKADAAFKAAGSEGLRAAIGAIFDGQPPEMPENWGSLFIAFPGAEPWAIPAAGWHADANFPSPLWPSRGVKTFVLLDDVAPRGGGTLFLSGSHRLVHDWLEKSPPPDGARSGEVRRHLRSHPYLRDLQSEGPADARIEHFMARTEMWEGIPLRVIEQTGRAGEALLAHPLLMHVAAPNNQPTPRMLLSGGITTDMWGWGG